MESKFMQEMTKIKARVLKECKICNGEGWIPVTLPNGKKAGSECECLKKVMRYVSYKLSGIGKEYWDLEKSDWYGDNQALMTTGLYITQIVKAKEDGYGLIYHGTNGRGKTFLSTLILKEALKKKYSAYIITVSELMKTIKGTFDRNYERAEENKEMYDKIRDVDFLVLDNMNSEYCPKNNADFNISEFDVLFRYRARECMPTIITSNYSEEEFKENYGKSIESLLSGKNKYVNVGGEDFRPKTFDDNWLGQGK